MSNPDIITGKAPGRYASALLDLAQEAKTLKTVEKDIATLKSAIAKHAVLSGMMSNPVYATHDKVTAMTGIAKKIGLSPLIVNFVGVVTENRRSAELPAIITAFEIEVAKRRGSQSATVTSAAKLTAAQLTKLKSELKKSLGRTVDVQTHVDPSLIGGFVVKIGSRLYDNSLKTQIEDLKLALKQA